MAKDTEKLIRQLSLISYLMAERRPVTALEIRRDVEGYSGMNEDAFARRFYADRAELESLGINLSVDKPADGFSEQENYSLAPEAFHLPAIAFSDDERAALQTALTLLDGEFAYAEPLRLALQQISWGRPSPLKSPDQQGVALGITASAGGHDLSQRLAKVETAIFRHKTITFDYYTMQRDDLSPRKVDPYHLLFQGGQFYLLGHAHAGLGEIVAVDETARDEGFGLGAHHPQRADDGIGTDDRDARQAFVFGIAPNANVRTLGDLRGKRIAFSPSQVQAQVVIQTLRAAGIRRDEVTLVELPSSIGGDVYTNALASGAIDVAPIRADLVAQNYVRDYGARGAHLLRHPPFRDDGGSIYVPEAALADPGKAAALRIFARYWGRNWAWINTHQEELARGYYAGKRGLPIADARIMAAYIANVIVPRNWDGVIAYEQAAIDTLGPETKHPRLNAATLFDRRFETIAADGAASVQGNRS